MPWLGSHGSIAGYSMWRFMLSLHSLSGVPNNAVQLLTETIYLNDLDYNSGTGAGHFAIGGNIVLI